MPDRLAVFVDYQNTYMSARRVFHNPQSDPHYYGQFWPHLLGRYLEDDAPPGYTRELTAVHVYRGIPDSSRDSKGYGAARKQHAAWEQQGNGKVQIHTRPLRYPYGWPDSSQPGDRPGEKGVDVELAIDMAMMAVRREFDVAILVSLDTDLHPPLEAVMSMPGHFPRAEVAAWSTASQHCRRLSLPKRNLYCHWIDDAAYQAMSDHTSYSS